MTFMQMAKIKRLASKPKLVEPVQSNMVLNAKSTSKGLVIDSVQADEGDVGDAKWQGIIKIAKVNLHNSVAKDTSEQYNYWCNRFKKFCSDFNRVYLPFTEMTCIGFLSYLAENSEGIGGVDQARSAIRKMFYMNFPNRQCPTESERVSMVVKGIKRRFQKPVQKKKPLAADDFSKLLVEVTSNGDLHGSKLVDIRFAAQIALIYCTFSRYEESAALRVEDIVEEDEDIVVNFPKGKQYQYGESRAAVILDQPQLKINPVFVIKFYLRKLQELGKGSQLLFPALRTRGKKVGLLNFAASYDCVLKQFRKYAEKAGIAGSPKDYGLHSCRRGAVTTSANNGCDDHTIQKQMRVASTSTVRRYATLNKKRLGMANRFLFQ